MTRSKSHNQIKKGDQPRLPESNSISYNPNNSHNTQIGEMNDQVNKLAGTTPEPMVTQVKASTAVPTDVQPKSQIQLQSKTLKDSNNPIGMASPKKHVNCKSTNMATLKLD